MAKGQTIAQQLKAEEGKSIERNLSSIASESNFKGADHDAAIISPDFKYEFAEDREAYSSKHGGLESRFTGAEASTTGGLVKGSEHSVPNGGFKYRTYQQGAAMMEASTANPPVESITGVGYSKDLPEELNYVKKVNSTNGNTTTTTEVRFD